MRQLLLLLVRWLPSFILSRASLQAENLALRHQLCAYQRSVNKPRIQPADRILWSLLAKAYKGWEDALLFVKPETVLRWQRKRFREHWKKVCKNRKPGRPPIPKELRQLIRTLSSMNHTWGAPHIVGELAKPGIILPVSTVSNYMCRADKPRSTTWLPFLKNHAHEIVSIDFLVVSTVRFQFLYVLIFLSIERRRIVDFNVTAHPTAEWTAQQVIEAFPWDTAPRYLLRDRDSIYGDYFKARVKGMGIEHVVTAWKSPWQNPYSERLNGSVRRECLGHVIVFSEAHLKRILSQYVEYYNQYRTHLSLGMDCPIERPAHDLEQGKIFSVAHLGGLHHHYERKAA